MEIKARWPNQDKKNYSKGHHYGGFSISYNGSIMDHFLQVHLGSGNLGSITQQLHLTGCIFKSTKDCHKSFINYFVDSHLHHRQFFSMNLPFLGTKSRSKRREGRNGFPGFFAELSACQKDLSMQPCHTKPLYLQNKNKNYQYLSIK